MTQNIFEEIKQAEESVRMAKAEASALAKKKLAKAENEAAELILKAEQDGENETARMLAEAEKNGERIASEIASSTENKRAVTKAGVEKRLEKAAQYIVERIVNG